MRDGVGSGELGETRHHSFHFLRRDGRWQMVAGERRLDDDHEGSFRSIHISTRYRRYCSDASR